MGAAAVVGQIDNERQSSRTCATATGRSGGVPIWRSPPERSLDHHGQSTEMAVRSSRAMSSRCGRRKRGIGGASIVNVRHEDGCGVVVLFAAPGGSLGVGLGELGLARPVDQLIGAVGGEEVE